MPHDTTHGEKDRGLSTKTVSKPAEENEAEQHSRDVRGEDERCLDTREIPLTFINGVEARRHGAAQHHLEHAEEKD